ncbi:MAG: Magnesium and cobalt transport protein CorA [uncultured Chloroflexia bacterium]|uniref:Magnesium and cobalt transport protein CorA n=1 Tax=uncultured Chloroflexia bacterium TaxID=1672391 RepID=A0A6J4KRZ4_9CHLR|nr:MAG: Magnesium and cobalt transport protein CorA [uncultured Chloroflexia bacterium]
MTYTAAVIPASKHPYLPPKPGIRVKNLQGCDDEAWHGQTQHVWVDVEAPTPEQVEELKRHFVFNKLALEDVLASDHWSRFERYPEHPFLIFRTLAEPEDLSNRTEEVDYFWFPEQHTLITFRDEPVTYLEAVWKETNGYKERTPVDILYDLLQRGTNTFFTYLDELEDRTEELEQRLFDRRTQPQPEGDDVRAQPLYQEIFGLRRTMISTRKRVSSAREYIMQFSRHAAEFSPEGSLYLRDVADHLARVYGGLDAARDVLGGLLEVYLSVENQRLNEVIRTLTTVSTIFLPLTFLAGVWGMNFQYEPEFGWRYGYLFAWTCFLIVGGSLLWYFKRKKWW